MFVVPTIKSAGVYLLENTVTGKVYVGSTTRNLRARIQHHQLQLRRGRHTNPKLQNAWAKYGEEAFTCRVLLVCAPKDCLFFEQRALDRFEACGPKGYNLVPKAGNVQGLRHTDEAKRKISRGNTGKIISDDQKLALSRAHKGKTISPENKEAVRRRHKGAPKSEEHRAKLAAAATGRSHSAETKAKIGAASRGRTFTDEQRESISAGVRQAYATTDLREKVAAASRGRKMSPAARAACDWTGRTHTDEAKRKIGEASAKRTHPPETKAKIAAALAGKKRGPYRKRVQAPGNFQTFEPNHDERTSLVLTSEE